MKDPNTFKELLVIGFISLCVVTGCNTTQQNNAFKTIGAVEATGKAAYDGYCSALISGQASTNSLPQIASAYNQFQADTVLAAVVSSQGTNGLAPASLTQELGALTSVISTAATIK
jgi:hypothetical protein